MEIKIKSINGGKIPSKANEYAAGIDCYANEDVILFYNKTTIIPLGFAIELPEHTHAEIRGRSGLAFNSGIISHNGTIDCDYRGEVKGLLFSLNQELVHVKKGDKICQMIIHNDLPVSIVECDELSETIRGSGGFGSTGKMNEHNLCKLREAFILAQFNVITRKDKKRVREILKSIIDIEGNKCA